jgi:hypothetical protein
MTWLDNIRTWLAAARAEMDAGLALERAFEGRCPRCGAEAADVSRLPGTPGPGGAAAPQMTGLGSCLACRGTWTETYQLADVKVNP